MDTPLITYLTSALPYANGEIHLGHLYEWLLSEAYLNYQKLFDENILWICGDDSHGTAISLKAKETNVSEEVLIENIHRQRKEFIEKLNLKFDIYSNTHTPIHIQKTKEWFLQCQKKGLIVEKISQQFFDPILNIYLNDRQIKGDCPHCKQPEQYGDACENCGQSYETFLLINPISTLTKTSPLIKEVTLCYLDISSFIPKIETTLSKLPSSIANKIAQDIKIAPKLWCIGRKGNYFGIDIPNKEEKFYVWFDAPIAYISFIEELLEQKKVKISTYDLVHIIGIDIIYFHIIFWQSLLLAQEFPVPKKFIVHGFVVDKDGNKFSKSKNNAPNLNQFLEQYSIDSIRYFFLSNTDDNCNNIKLDTREIVKKFNTLGSQFINVFHRLLGLSQNVLVLKEELSFNKKLDEHFCQKIKAWSGNGDFKSISNLIQEEVFKINENIQSEKLWVDTLTKKELLKKIWSQYLFLLYWLSPLIPQSSKVIIEKIEKNNFNFNKNDFLWNKIQQ